MEEFLYTYGKWNAEVPMMTYIRKLLSMNSYNREMISIYRLAFLPLPTINTTNYESNIMKIRRRIKWSTIVFSLFKFIPCNVFNKSYKRSSNKIVYRRQRTYKLRIFSMILM